jgi:hypothetical protein
MTVLSALASARALDEVAELIDSTAWKDHLADLAKAPEAKREEIERLRRAVTDAKTRLSPEHSSKELQALKSAVYSEGAAADPAALRGLLVCVAAARAALPVREHERLFGRIDNALGQELAGQNTGTGYSNRARRARDLFTEHAGRTRIEGAAADRHGNAAGTAYDLGRDGAFEGHAVHVLHFYRFNFSKPQAAFERKGFRVERLTQPGSPDELRRWLADARQLWLISDSTPRLTNAHIAVIREFWERGGALYIWGDNEPFYADANAVLRKLFGHDFKMEGNLLGSQVVHEISPDQRGFLPHLVTTGLVHLFEGITVASLDRAVAESYGFEPLLYGSAGNLITVARGPSPDAGAIMVDGAFTRLYCQWDEAGSARYVCNAACFLAAMTLPEDQEEGPAGEPVAPRPEDLLPYDPIGALEGACDLTGKPSDTWLVLSVGQMADALANTSDFVLTDPLSAGARNCIFSDAVYGESLGRWIVEQGLDPASRRAVVDVLPLVDLSSPRNLREFTRQLCRSLLGGKYLPTAARLMFFAVVDEMLSPERQLEHRGAWEYLYRQCLANFTSTPELSDLGRPVPLLEAMTTYFSPATEEMVQLRRSFTTVGVIGRTLLREGRAAPAQVRLIARRSLLKALVGDAVAAEKSAPGTVKPQVLALLYRTFGGIPTLDGGRVFEGWPAFAEAHARDRKRLEDVLGAPLLSPQDGTVALHALLGLDLRQYTAESAVQKMREESPHVRSVWDDRSPGDVLALLNARFAAYHEPRDLNDPHLTQVPPFATTLGPSVYRCLCGQRFGDPAQELTPEVVAALQAARNEHFRNVYRAREVSWYPGEGTLHYNLHRAVQRVVAERFTEATAASEEMVLAVADYLREDAKGFIFDPLLPDFIRTALESYLSLRRAGQPHPTGVLTLQVKAERERQLLLGR